MAAVIGHLSARASFSRGLWVLSGLLALYVPTYVDLYQTFWAFGRAVQGPVILGWMAWLLWRDRASVVLLEQPQLCIAALGAFVLGLLCHALGRSQGFVQLQIASQIPLLLGLARMLVGRAGLRRLVFPIAFTAFLIPVPGTMLDQLLLPLKQLVSAIADSGLHALGYPIARNGVVLMIGRYDLLIADACSGLNSMVALAGMGLIYTYVVGRRSRWHNVLLLVSVLPIAFAANVLRVLALLLITFYAGDAAGRTFHASAAWLEIGLAFVGFFAIDRLLGWALAWTVRSKPRVGAPGLEPA